MIAYHLQISLIDISTVWFMSVICRTYKDLAKPHLSNLLARFCLFLFKVFNMLLDLADLFGY